MKKPCGNSHPLFNPGSIQSLRAPKYLLPDTVLYDERTISDWLVYLSKYGEHINYFSLVDEENPDGDWSKFFDQDISVLLARIAEEQVSSIQTDINNVVTSLKKDDLTPLEAREEFTLLFAHVFNIVWRLDQYYKNLERGLSFKQDIENTALTNIEIRLLRLIGFYKSAKAQNLFDEPTDQNLPEPYVPILNIESWDLQPFWFSQSIHTNWSDYVAGIAPDIRPFKHNILTPTNDAQKINLAANYQLLVEAIKGILKAFTSLIVKANKQFQETVTDWPDHQPDRALLISFLHLLEIYRNEINTLTKRHLDHYYKGVLQLDNKAAEPDSVFVVAELAKNISEAEIETGTLFTGGKDDDGVERLYATEDTQVLNTAKVLYLKNKLKQDGNIYAAQNAATANGIDEELEFPELGWPAFGSTKYAQATVGFAVASDHLFAKDGTRKVELEVVARANWKNATLNRLAANSFLQVSTEDGWVKLENTRWKKDKKNARKAIITGVIPEDTGAVVAVSEEVHERTYYDNLPVLEIHISANQYSAVHGLEIEEVSVALDVTGSTHAPLNTILGNVDAVKSFQPFGALPKVGDAVVVGAHEMLAKNLNSLQFNVRWSKPDDGEQDISNFRQNITKLTFQQLQGGEWKKPTVTSTQKSGGLMEYKWSGLKKQKNNSENYSSRSIGGFLRMLLDTEIGHAGFADEMATYGQAIAQFAKNGGTAPTPPKPYHIPTVESFTIDYNASESITVSKTSANQPESTQFYHLTSFGGYSASGNAVNQNYPTLVNTASNEGEFFIGIENFSGGQQVNVLIQVDEGSANPLKAKQNISWSYLHNNVWVEFEQGDLADGTEGLIKTGIVTLALPFGFNDHSTFFNERVTWVRATIAQHVDAVCSIVGVYAQAVKATLTSNGHGDAHYSTPVAAETVTKLKVSDAEIKKLAQPAASSDGRPRESDGLFYTRVSERLRHKNRAVSMWDYERIILEEFPNLAMVKTLSHTKYFVHPKTNNIDYSESAPGHVAVVCVPKKQNALAQQKPYTPIDQLEDVKNQVLTVCPDWATVHVRNPLFEEIQVDCRVQFQPYINDIEYYLEVLKQDLEAYFSPWTGQTEDQLRFGWRVHKSMVIDFMDERPYVDYVRDVKINHVFGDAANERNDDVEEVIPRFAVSVLVSSSKHVINPVS